ncbi:ABC transporter substrate-binding protein [Micromonospora sp. NBC_00898]|uniref:ABC transporter substrate-binding protein n=1 Tax=Micromonospora sp. NBC_00898 TaxID=2975981 RepID=UPI003869A8FB|nr:ABC transporter substrate-binding protein [Micromonospora sp. NBC_00898]
MAGGLTLALAACGGSSAPGASASGGSDTKNLEVFSWWTSGSESAALKAMFDGYSKANPGINVVNGAVAGGGGSNAQAVLQTRLQGGNPPDIWQTHPGAAIKQYIDGGLVGDASSVYTSEVKAAIPKDLVDAISADGKQYGVSAGAHRGNVLWFNKQVLEKAGVAVPGPSGYGTEAFLADLAKLKSAGVVPLCLGGKDTFAIAELFENTLLGSLGADAWKQLTTGGAKWDSDKVKAAAANTAKMLQYADPDASALSWDQATKKLAAGSCAFESMGDWAYGELVKDGAQPGTAFGYTNHPGTDGTFIAVVDTMVMAKNAKNPTQAEKFLEAVASKEVQIAFNKEKGSVPLRTDVDVSSLSAYQQQAAKSFASDAIVQSVVHGEAMNPQFGQALFDAVTQFTQSKDVNGFTQALANAAQS